ncbi:MAG: dihydrodipicolinate synthase family protein [Acidobacteriota bacterium]
MTRHTRREFLAAAGVAALASRAGGLRAASVKPMRGAFMILHTPFTSDGALDWQDLAREAQFVDRAGCHGVVWPQGSSRVAALTRDERLRGLEVLAKAMQGARAALVLGVQGRDTDEMLDYTRRAEALAPDALIAMPPASGKTMEDYARYFRALAQATARPVIVQTSGPNRALAPSTDLLVQLAREFPHVAYVKEESEPVIDRMKEELRHKPPIKGVFGANLGVNWLYGMRLGLDGVITGNAMVADLMARLWDLHTRGKSEELREAYAQFLLIRNLDEQVPGTTLYLFRKRGLFKTTVTRTAAPGPDGRATLSTNELPPDAIAEIEYRFAGLRKYLGS